MGNGLLNQHENIKCKVWSTEIADFVHPELRLDDGGIAELLKKQNIGLCLSGGGMRAATNALGWVRGLHHIGLLKNIRYVSAVSGSSWLVGPLAYQTKCDIETFLGPYIEPKDCSLKTVRQFERHSFSKCLEKVNFKEEVAERFFEQIIEHPGTLLLADKRDFWAVATSHEFFKPFDLHDYRLLTTNNSKVEKILHLKRKSVNSLDVMGYPIINAAMRIIDTKDQEIPLPVEFTPLYFGLPVAALAALPSISTDPTVVHVGGLYVEPHGFKAAPSTEQVAAAARAVNSAPRKTAVIKLPRPDSIVSLSEQAGLSSNYLAAGLTFRKEIYELLRFPYMPHWNLHGPSNEFLYCDAGANDVLGVTALLRRKVNKIIMGVSLSHSIHPTVFKNSEYHGDSFALCELAACFGRATAGDISGRDLKLYNSIRHVFSSSDWDRLASDIMTKHAAGGAVVSLLKTRTVENAHAGVSAGLSVALLVVVNAYCPTFEALLPRDTRERLHKDCVMKWVSLTELAQSAGLLKENFAHFPYISVQRLNYSPELIGCLSQLSSWAIVSSKLIIDEFVSLV